jgi:hypothetical protein
MRGRIDGGLMIGFEGMEDVEDGGCIEDGGRGLGEDAEEDDEGTSREVDDGIFGNKKFGDDILPKSPIGIRRSRIQQILSDSSHSMDAGLGNIMV